MTEHIGKGNVWGGLACAVDQPGVLLRKEALRNGREQINRQRERDQKHDECRKLMLENKLEPALIGAQYGFEPPLTHEVEPPVLLFAVLLQEARGHHWRQGQGDQ